MTTKLFTDVKIGRRLAIGFGITIAFMAVSVIAGQIYFTRVGGDIDHLVKVNNAKLKNAYEMKIALGDLTRPIAEIVTGQDSRAKEEAKTRIGRGEGKIPKGRG